MAETVTIGSKSYLVNIRRSGSRFHLQIDDRDYDGEFSRLNNGSLEIIIDGRRSITYSEKKSNESYVFANGINYVLHRQPYRVGSVVQDEPREDSVMSPITGKLLDRKVKRGSSVREGDVIIVMEAMKMEHRLRSPRDGIISQITSIEIGGQVKEGEIMFELEDE
jgi:3-methylcrotonyl-CoA carboxylase alpha subunit